MTSLDAAKIFVGGRWSESSNPIEVYAPGDNELVGTTFEATHELVEQSIVAAESSRVALNDQAPFERSLVLRNVAAGMLGELEHLAQLLSAEAGKPIRDARTEIQRSALTFRLAAEEAERIGGEVLDLGLNAASKGRYGITRRFPAGLVAGIVPFNLPVSLSSHKIAPAMAVGCPIVLKAPSQSPLALLEVAKIIEEAGAPLGSVTIMPMSIEVGDQLVTDDRFKVLSFTGSPRIGWSLKARAGKKRVVLELGGNAGAVVDRSANLDWAASKCAMGAFKYAGQTCISVQRIFVHHDVWESFLEKFVSSTKGLKMGEPSSESTDVGPVIDISSASRVRTMIEDAIALGGQMVEGGPGEGTYIPPTVLTNVPRSAAICREEVFGPVAILEEIPDFQSGLKAINDSNFGLQAGIFTADLANVLEAFDSLDVGGVIINDSPTYRIDHMPYGGVKDSGLGDFSSLPNQVEFEMEIEGDECAS
jgi:acyl-CoA reductase-like NAD-dependent aldehyde dehydrogenase